MRGEHQRSFILTKIPTHRASLLRNYHGQRQVSLKYTMKKILTHKEPEPINGVLVLAWVLCEEVMDVELDTSVGNCFRKLLSPEYLRTLDRAGLILQYHLERREGGVHVLQDVEGDRTLPRPNINKGRIRWERLPGEIGLERGDVNEACIVMSHQVR